MSRQKPSLAVAASIAALAAHLTPAVAAPPVDVTVVNFSFEDPPLDNGMFALGGVAPWSDFDAFGPLDPPNSILNEPVPDGENVAFSNLTGGNTAEQVVEARICDGDELTLKVFVGARNDALTFGGYLIALEAVADDDSRTPIASVSSQDLGAVIPTAGHFADITLTYTVKGDSFIGDRIAIKLGSFRTPTQQTLFDDVRLVIQTHSIQVPDCVPTIQEAIDMAEDGDEIVLQPGYYAEHLDFAGKNVTIRSTDPEDPDVINATRIVPVFRGAPDGPVPPLVTFDSGEGPGAGLLGLSLDSYFNVVAGGAIYIAGASPTIASCFLYDGDADTYGGSVYIENGAPSFEQCGFYDNSADLGGGAMYIGPGSDPSVTGCEFYENWTDFGSGGVISIAPDADATIAGCDFGLAYADDFGGCIYIDSRGDVQIQSCEFLGKLYAPLGGAIFSRDSSPNIEDCEFTYCDAYEGGAIFAYDGSPTVSDCYFGSNNAEYELRDTELDEDVRGIGARPGGGGAYAQNLGQALIQGCYFEFNYAAEGGAIRAQAADVTIDGCDFYYNAASQWSYGGAVAIMGGSVNLSHSYFAANESDGFGGAFAVWAYSDTPDLGSMTNCVFDHNFASDAGGAAFVWGGFQIGNCTFNANRVIHARFIGGGDSLALIRDPGDGPLDVFNSILWGSDDQINASPNAGPINLSYSDIQDGIPLGVSDAGGNIFSFPKFVDINGSDNNPDTVEDNDFRLAHNSWCIDAGDTPTLLAVDASAFDIDSNDRVLDDIGVLDTGIIDDDLGATVDMGAYEFIGVSDPRCNVADLAEPFGTLDFSDVLAYLEAFANKDSDADLDVQYGTLDFSDVFAFLVAFGAGCK
ncbi:MAG: right-handed parallel beta-helix repeat-containing protein [Phycisphaerales bacterium]